MGKGKNKNRQLIFVSILIIALVSIFLITQFDPTGKFLQKKIVVNSGSGGDKVIGGDKAVGKVDLILTNKAPVFEFDPTDLKKYQIPNREADADYSFEWPLEESGVSLNFKTKDKNCDILSLPSAEDTQGNTIPVATKGLIFVTGEEYKWMMVLQGSYTYPISLSVTEESRDYDCDGIPNEDDDDYTSNVIDNSNDNVQGQGQSQGFNTQVDGSQQASKQQHYYQGNSIAEITGDVIAGNNIGAGSNNKGGLNDPFDLETTTLKIYVYPSEAEIEPIINIYLKDNPELELDSIPILEKVIIDASKSTINDEIPSIDILTAEWTTPDLTAEWTTPDLTEESSEPLKKEGYYSSLGTKDISLTLKLKNFPDVVSETITTQIDINNGVYAILSNPKDGDKIPINELVQFMDESYSLTEPIISSIIDFDDEEQAWGAFSVSAPITEVPTCFSKIGTNEFCIGDNILTLDNQIYDGVTCGCKNYHMSFPTKKKDITGFVGGTTAHKYESVNACGDDKICNVNLTIKTENYEASTQINLIFDKQAICEDDPENDICKTQTIDDICDRFPAYFVQCNLDTAPSNLTNDTTKLDAFSTNVSAQDNYVTQNTPNKDQYDDPLDNMKEKEKKPSEKYNNYDYGGDDKNEGSSGSGGMMLIVILLITLFGGVGFFLWKRSKSSGSKPENGISDSTEASTDEPEQSSDL